MPYETYVTYWRVQAPVNLSIVDLETDEILYQEDMILGNLIICRYPLLEQITYEYEDRLTSTGPLMMETTALAQGFTMGRGYFQYLYPGGPDNRELKNNNLPIFTHRIYILIFYRMITGRNTGVPYAKIRTKS
jgi:hypothetical protein